MHLDVLCERRKISKARGVGLRTPVAFSSIALVLQVARADEVSPAARSDYLIREIFSPAAIRGGAGLVADEKGTNVSSDATNTGVPKNGRASGGVSDLCRRT